ncbi:response regulator [Streptosporangium carneum]|uniref:DNA-binding response regulator n=1 Tax=Streptosporangium carneum TaxID=47481 RepID=A0A9W6IAS9_9ACTN|nr:response regulator transcription factor [Streptosporangium carneum]GLK14631.1 DNA-binding response regulator [Streptosporangium carneum]
MIRVVLADDETMVRVGISGILASDPGISVVGEACDGAEAVELVRRHRPQVALIDIQMPKMDGLSAAEEIRRTVPETGVVMLTTFSQDEYITRALRIGTNGFLLKSGNPHELINGVHAVAEGGACLSPKVAARVINSFGGERRARGDAIVRQVGVLTDREREVLALLGAGLSNADIGRRLFLVEGTVKVYVSTILTKLNVRNRVQAAIIAYEAGLVGEIG